MMTEFPVFTMAPAHEATFVDLMGSILTHIDADERKLGLEKCDLVCTHTTEGFDPSALYALCRDWQREHVGNDADHAVVVRTLVSNLKDEGRLVACDNGAMDTSDPAPLPKKSEEAAAILAEHAASIERDMAAYDAEVARAVEGMRGRAADLRASNAKKSVTVHKMEVLRLDLESQKIDVSLRTQTALCKKAYKELEVCKTEALSVPDEDDGCDIDFEAEFARLLL